MMPALSAPIGKQNQQIAHPDGAIVIQVSYAVVAIIARPPTRQQNEQIADADRSVAIEIAGDGISTDDPFGNALRREVACEGEVAAGKQSRSVACSVIKDFQCPGYWRKAFPIVVKPLSQC